MSLCRSLNRCRKRVVMPRELSSSVFCFRWYGRTCGACSPSFFSASDLAPADLDDEAAAGAAAAAAAAAGALVGAALLPFPAADVAAFGVTAAASATAAAAARATFFSARPISLPMHSMH